MKLKLLTACLLISITASGQKIVMKEKLADKYYKAYSYYKAIPLYEELIKKYPSSVRIYDKLADSYVRMNDTKNEERCYSFLAKQEAGNAEYKFRLAQALAANGKYSESAQWYKKYSASAPADKRGTGFADLYSNLGSLLNDSANSSVNKVDFNSATSDFSPAYFGDKIVFPSSRKEISVIRQLYNRTQSSYLDLYEVDKGSGNAVSFSQTLNTKYHEGPLVFTKNLDTVFFTRNNFYDNQFGKSTDGINKLELFIAVKKTRASDWTDVTPLPFNDKQFSVGHPALDKSGSYLYFVSDRPGGMGGTDIWVAHLTTDKSGNKSWSEPQNLGGVINTPGDEMFPFIDNSGNLWFASDGHPGLGRLDIFMSAARDNGFVKPVNAGYPLNTRFDDFGLITDDNGNEGYLSSDRNNTPGDDDIYSFKKLAHRIAVKVFDSKTKKAIPEAIVTITNGYKKSDLVTDNTGLIAINATGSAKYELRASHEGFNDGYLEVASTRYTGNDTVLIPLSRRIPKAFIKGKVYSADNNDPFPGAIAIVTNKTTGEVKEIPVDSKGELNADLQPETDYQVKVSVASAGSKCSAGSNDCTTKGLKSDVSFNLMFPVFCVGDVIKVENIYYDLGKYNIRPDAAKELDKLFDLMKSYPAMKIELRSHTDSRGSHESNMVLSQKRAQSAADYLFSRGIERDRITSKGYGDTMPLNKCVKGVKCTEEEFQVNRRTEFKILSVK
jgi:outer membrane protein OmpA-like peptidoglycan-associated protein